MRWLVEVSSLGKSDLQKICVEAESWQRALQAARAQRGEEGPMSGFSIELLEEGYRAVDPLARVRFVVKRAPDDAPLSSAPAKGASAPGAKAASAPGAKAQNGVPAPSASSAASNEPTRPKIPQSPASSSAGVRKGPPRPTPSSPPSAPASVPPPSSAEAKPKSLTATMTFSSAGQAKVADKTDNHPVAERAPAPAIGSAIVGLPAVKLVSSREQDPTDASPLTYREYAFAVPAGTSEGTAADVLRAQLRLVEAHIATAKSGKLVNLAAFDVEFTGKPPKAPLATLTWKDWKGEPVIAFPQKSAASKPPRPPSAPPPAPASVPAPAPSAPAPSAPSAPAPAPAPSAPAPAPAPSAPSPAPAAAPAPAPAAAPAPAPAAAAPASAPAAAPAPARAPSAPPPAPAPAPPAPAAAAPAAAPALTPAAPPAPVVTEAPAAHRAALPTPADMIRTPSGRFVRGRVTGDELITALFESMHDLHFLRDALDGGQFCLALATEVLPARAALIHFFDIEKREWVVACTRGRDTQALLAKRSAEADPVLRDAARKRRAVVIQDESVATSDRYRHLGGGRSLIAAPIMQAGRALGAIEIINPLDGRPFTEDEGNAITYIAEQYAEYLGSRGIVLDRDRIQSAAAAT